MEGREREKRMETEGRREREITRRKRKERDGTKKGASETETETETDTERDRDPKHLLSCPNPLRITSRSVAGAHVRAWTFKSLAGSTPKNLDNLHTLLSVFQDGSNETIFLRKKKSVRASWSDVFPGYLKNTNTWFGETPKKKTSAGRAENNTKML